MKIYNLSIDLTEDELRGLAFVADSFGQHMAEGLGTGDEESDRQARSAAAWIGRAVLQAVAEQVGDEVFGFVKNVTERMDRMGLSGAIEVDWSLEPSGHLTMRGTSKLRRDSGR